MAARQSKRASARKRTAKKAPAKKKPNGAPPAPIEKTFKGELRYKLKAAFLEWQAEDQRIIAEAQKDIQKVLDRRRRNDAAWKRTNKDRLAAFNEVVDTMTPKLPEGFAIKHINATEGSYRAEHDPEGRGKHVE
jgi:predicted metal-dependent peptidase